MAVSRKILIRVIGAPLLLGVLGVLLWLDYTDPYPGDPNKMLATKWLVAVLCTLAVLEFYGLCRLKGIQTAHVAGAVCMAFVMGLWPWLLGTLGLSGFATRFRVLQNLAVVILGMHCLWKLVFHRDRFTIEGAVMTMAGFFYVRLLAHVFDAPIASANVNTYWYFLVFLLAANKASDMAAYVCGKAFGRHKMAPTISPNKTWEGAFAGVIAGTGAGLAILMNSPLRDKYPTASVVTLLLFSAFVTIAAQVGDLVESAFKRWAGAKDSGRFIPEFGGVLDMVDSFLVSAPVAYLLSVLVMQ